MLKNRLTRAAAVVAATAVMGVAGPVGTAQAATPTQYANDAFVQTNNERVARDLRALNASSCLKTYSNRQAAAMAKAKRMYHQDLGPILSACGLSRVGENVASGYATGYKTTRAWMGSPGHRANILNPSFRVMAVSAAQDSSGRWYAAQVFGTPR